MHYSSVIPRSFVLAAALLAGACSSPDGPLVLKDREKILETQDQMSTATFDMSRVVVVRVRVDDETREVTSIMPMIVAQSVGAEGVARTIFRVEQKTDTLTLFTRDAQNKIAYRVDIGVKDHQARPSVMFPVLDRAGNAVQRKVSVEAVFSK